MTLHGRLSGDSAVAFARWREEPAPRRRLLLLLGVAIKDLTRACLTEGLARLLFGNALQPIDVRAELRFLVVGAQHFHKFKYKTL